MVELQLPKLVARVRFPSLALIEKPRVSPGLSTFIGCYAATLLPMFLATRTSSAVTTVPIAIART